MRHRRSRSVGITILAAIGLLCTPGTTFSQDSVSVRISTNFEEAVLFADSVRIGRVPGEPLRLSSEVRVLRLAAPEGSSWTIEPLIHPIGDLEGDTSDVRMDFPYYFRVESIPFGANVHHETSAGWKPLGTTPLTFTSTEPLEGVLAVERAGYVIERLDPGKAIWNRLIVTLKPSDEPDPTGAQVRWSPPPKRRDWIDYAALGTAVAAGVLAVHYKFKADDLYSRYEQTRDQSLRPEIKSYDVRSGVAFGVMQGGIGLFALRLALR